MCKERGGDCGAVASSQGVFAPPPFFHTLFGRHRCVDGVCHSPPTRFSQRERRAEVEGDGGGRETQKEKTREDGAQQRSVLVCGNQHTHSGCALPHTQREDKTRHGNGDTHMGMDETTGHDTQGGGKGREKTRGGSSQDTHHYTKEKEKGKKTMTKPKDNEER